ncbi:hypothetical protein [Mucilaginibacter sp. UYCu711]|uniref:hypothetical protein n=1 Tax=Mucilaginibacter sp. UYCu711 TaxID=3156339 RepID=UPI003D1A438D
MSEEKIIQHTKKALAALGHKTTLWEKAKEFVGEIVIIIIAVSITLAFHNWNEERHEEKLEHEFLKGISADLKQSSKNLTLSVTQFQPTIDYYDHVWAQIRSGKIDAKYVDTSSSHLRNTSYFVFDNSRFEGFKSSGYLRLIKNEALLKQLVTLYTVIMPFERDADTHFYTTRSDDFNKYIGTVAAIDDNGNFIVSPLLKDRAVQFQLFNYLDIFRERKAHKQKLAKTLLDVAAEVDKELAE